jgi:hypothetical protein
MQSDAAGPSYRPRATPSRQAAAQSNPALRVFPWLRNVPGESRNQLPPALSETRFVRPKQTPIDLHGPWTGGLCISGMDEVRESLRRFRAGTQRHTAHAPVPMHEPPRCRPTNVFEAARSPANPFVAAGLPVRALACGSERSPRELMMMCPGCALSLCI